MAATARPDDEEFDPLTRVASEQTLAEKLLMDMGAALPDEDMPIAEYLVGSLDEKGYLAVKVEDVAYELTVVVDKVRAVLRVLQAQEPVGIGARHLRECLSIQIAHLEERGLSHPHALRDRDPVPDRAGRAQVRPHRARAARSRSRKSPTCGSSSRPS